MFDSASSSLAQLSYMEETTWGVTPVAGPGAKNLRMTGESLKIDMTKTASEEIQASRQVKSLFVTDLQATGGINFEMSFKEYDALLAGLMMADWNVYGTNGLSASLTGTLAVADGTKDVITFDAAPAGNDALSKLAVGQWISLLPGTGAAPSAANLGARRVIGKTATTLELEKVTGGVLDTAKTFKIRASRLTHGTTKKSFTLEKAFTDVNQYFIHRGMMVSKLSLSLKGKSAITGSFDFLGRDGFRADATSLPGVIAASEAYPVMSSVTGVSKVRMAGQDVNTLYSTYLKELSLDFDNALQGQDALGELGNVGVMLGTIALSGSFQAYLNDGSLYDDFIASITQSLSFLMTDTQGQGYAVTVTNMDMSSVNVVAGKKDESVMLEVNWTALEDAASGKSIFIDLI